MCQFIMGLILRKEGSKLLVYVYLYITVYLYIYIFKDIHILLYSS